MYAKVKVALPNLEKEPWDLNQQAEQNLKT